MMKISFFGASGEVTGSSYLVETDRARVLVDFGLHQGGPAADRRNRRFPPIDPARLNAVVLTHAHIDHTGRLPLLAVHGYHGAIYGTSATCDLTEILLKDSAGIQEMDIDKMNRRRIAEGKAPTVPLYTLKNTRDILALLKDIPYDQPREIAPGITIRYVDAGHILGSASIEMTVREGSNQRIIAFSGDIGDAGAPLLKDPTPLTRGDVVIMESTYGDRDHRSREASVEQLADVITTARAQNGKVLIPAFAVGRTQQLIYNLGELARAGRLRAPGIYIDSPMATRTTDLYARHRGAYDDETWAIIDSGAAPLAFSALHFTRSVQESMRLNSMRGGNVIIAASGMCTGGRIVHHLLHNLAFPNTHIVIVGFQAHGSVGRQLVDGARTVWLFGQPVAVRATIHTIGGFSAHAGQSGLMRWASGFKHLTPRPQFFLTHGEPSVRSILQQKLSQELGIQAACPQLGDVAEL
ncbi:MAG: MBL fold metallo-hydrolase [Pyrinomonadaceae bacterium]|nr:MBL fold metallo-hydrolase [Phycisphaerales bacterium]